MWKRWRIRLAIALNSASLSGGSSSRDPAVLLDRPAPHGTPWILGRHATKRALLMRQRAQVQGVLPPGTVTTLQRRLAAQPGLKNHEIRGCLRTARQRCQPPPFSGRCRRWSYVYPEEVVSAAPGGALNPQQEGPMNSWSHARSRRPMACRTQATAATHEVPLSPTSTTGGAE